MPLNKSCFKGWPKSDISEANKKCYCYFTNSLNSFISQADRKVFFLRLTKMCCMFLRLTKKCYFKADQRVHANITSSLRLTHSACMLTFWLNKCIDRLLWLLPVGIQRSTDSWSLDECAMWGLQCTCIPLDELSVL